MYSWERDKLVNVQTASIVEDLGQVGYIFTDKTGTLTRNVMEFRYMLIGNEFYGNKQKFESPVAEEGENEGMAFKKMKTKMETGQYKDPNSESTKWSCANYKSHIDDEELEINKNITSVGKNDNLKMVC